MPRRAPPLAPLDVPFAAVQAALDDLGPRVDQAAGQTLLALDPAIRALLMDQAGDEPRARAQLREHAVEALVAEELLVAHGGGAHLPALQTADDPAHLVWHGLGTRVEQAARRAIQPTLGGLPFASDAPLFPRTFPERAAKRRGGHDTGQELVELLLDMAGWDGRGRCLEPAAGSGAFLRAAWARARAARSPGPQRELFGATALEGTELHPYACRAGRTALALDATRLELPPVAVPRLNRGDALDPLAAPGPWDLIVGNPPWVRGERLPAAQRAALRARWPELGGGNVDLAAWCVRATLERLAPGGRLAFVLPQGLFEAAAAGGLRALLSRLQVEALLSLEWAGPSPFAGAQVIPCLLVVRNQPPAPDHRVALGRADPGPSPLRERVGWHHLPQRTWLRLARPRGRRGRWILGLEPGEARLLRTLGRAPRGLEAGYGLAIRTATRARALVGDAAAARDFQAPRPLLDGREVRAFAIDWTGRWLDYDPDAISDPKSEAFFAAPKLVAARIALTLQAAVDPGASEPGPFFARNTVMVLRAPGTPLATAPHALAALINSLPLRAYAFRALRAGALAGSHRCTFYARLLQDLPLPPALLTDPALVARLDRLGRRAAASAAAQDAEGLARVTRKIDALVARAFGLDARDLRRLRARAARPPLDRILGSGRAGAPRRIAVQAWEPGARYA